MERDEKMIHQEFDLKRELAQQAGSQKSVKDEVKLTKNMTIPDMVKVMMPEIKKALPTVLTPERFTRIALSALNNTPALQKCTPMSFLAALMNAAQLGDPLISAQRQCFRSSNVSPKSGSCRKS